MTQIAVIVAAASNGVIGADNHLPWHLPEDLRYFKRVTMGKPIVMGRRTFDSIGRALPGRVNIVVSRDPGFSAEGTRVARSFEAALALAGQAARNSGAQEIVVIGGSQIYARALPNADRLYLTEVHAAVDGDALLPPLDWSSWEEVSRERHTAAAGNPYDYSFVVFNRRRA